MGIGPSAKTARNAPLLRSKSGAKCALPLVVTSGRSVFGKKSKRWKPLLQASQKASERSGRLEAMEAEKKDLEETLKGLEAKLATSQARLQTLTDEQTRLSEDCRYFEQGAQALESDLGLLGQRW